MPRKGAIGLRYRCPRGRSLECVRSRPEQDLSPWDSDLIYSVGRAGGPRRPPRGLNSANLTGGHPSKAAVTRVIGVSDPDPMRPATFVVPALPPSRSAHHAPRSHPGVVASHSVGGACALEEPEPLSACDEFHAPPIPELEGKPDHVPIERRRHIHIADVEDHIADALHSPTIEPQAVRTQRS
jgi:hypothetical protein